MLLIYSCRLNNERTRLIDHILIVLCYKMMNQLFDTVARALLLDLTRPICQDLQQGINKKCAN